MQQTTLLITASPITASSRWRRGMKVLSTALLMGAALVSTVQANDAPPQDAQKPTEIRIGLPDQSAGSKPFIRGPLGLAHIRQQLEKEFEPQGIKIQWSFFKGAGPAVNEALAARRVDAVWGGVSLLALRKQGINIVTTSRALGWPNTTQAAVLATQDFIDRYPGTTQQLVNVLVDNAQWIGDAQHLPEYTALMAEQSQIPQAIFQEELKAEDLPFQSSPRLDPFLLSSLQDSIERAKAAGLIRNTFSASDWFAGQFVDRALKAKGLESNWAVYDASGNPTK
ncbi:ABC transporter substrate-binding protein [Pectobacterium brasiliense]|uniref:ABC transporter substrate-binding protein n=1 Tax=Pectobacterium brasiliense TaxID=180957 RepID=UPI001969A20F|nr:ABC transporter substrate-binding protein [Pectobacterium brasiliense]MBN3230923.1 ABC transporter substrate-binding protein [Pectobacterium brasiliense]